MKRGVLFALGLALLLQACGQTPTAFRPLPSALGDIRGVAMGFEGLLPLQEGEGRYAAWVNLERGEIVALGGFRIDENGRPIDQNGDLIERFVSDQNLFKSVSMLITIEPFATVGDSPGSAVILQGPVIEGVVQLTVPAPQGVRAAQGSYRVFTPTDGPGTNEGSGVWAVSVAGDPLLQLPSLNNLYAYEHYMVIDGVTLTMGRFLSPAAADFINLFSGSEPAPAFPGEDFLVDAPAGVKFPANLAGARLIVTLEPILDDTADPSQLVIFEATLPASVVGGETIALTNRAADFPTGTAVIF
jgi:hypothetical protein